MESGRRTILAGALAAGGAAVGALWPRPAVAAGIRRIGILDGVPADHEFSMVNGFVTAMTKLGYIEGKNVEYLRRYPEAGPRESHATRLAGLADELVRAKPDAIVATGTLATKALARATATIPIVTNVADPVGAGFAKSVARPGGNITGVSLAGRELNEKTYEMLKAIIPGDWSLAIGLAGNPAEVQSFVALEADAARRHAIPVRTVDFRGMDAVQADRAFASMRGQGVRVLALFGRIPGIPHGDMHFTHFATRYGLASLPSSEDEVAKGALLIYTVSEDDVDQRKALQLARILRGTPPADIPFDTSTRFRLAINRKTARVLGLTIPREILILVDKVYD